MIFFTKLIAMHFGIALSIKDIFNDIVKGSMKFGAAFSSGMQSWYSKKLFFGGSWLCLGTKIVPICTFSQRYNFVMWCGFSFFLFLSSRRVSLAACGIWNWTRCRHRAPLTVWEWHPATSSPSSPGFTSPVREDIWPSVSPSIKHASDWIQKGCVQHTWFIAPLCHARRIAGVGPGPGDPAGGASGFRLWAPAAHWSQEISTAESLSEPGPGDTAVHSHIHTQ